MGFQVVSGLSINLAKSELIRLEMQMDNVGLAKVLGCRVAKLSTRYLRAVVGCKIQG